VPPRSKAYTANQTPNRPSLIPVGEWVRRLTETTFYNTLSIHAEVGEASVNLPAVRPNDSLVKRGNIHAINQHNLSNSATAQFFALSTPRSCVPLKQSMVPLAAGLRPVNSAALFRGRNQVGTLVVQVLTTKKVIVTYAM
jgi:hypothetical protein